MAVAGVAEESGRAFELSLAAKLWQARQDAGLTQAEVGQALGISAEGYGNFERAARCIGVAQLRRAAELFGKPVSYFFGASADDLSSITGVEREVIGILRGLSSRDLAIVMVMLRSLTSNRAPQISGEEDAVEDKDLFTMDIGRNAAWA